MQEAVLHQEAVQKHQEVPCCPQGLQEMPSCAYLQGYLQEDEELQEGCNRVQKVPQVGEEVQKSEPKLQNPSPEQEGLLKQAHLQGCARQAQLPPCPPLQTCF